MQGLKVCGPAAAVLTWEPFTLYIKNLQDVIVKEDTASTSAKIE